MCPRGAGNNGLPTPWSQRELLNFEQAMAHGKKVKAAREGTECRSQKKGERKGNLFMALLRMAVDNLITALMWTAPDNLIVALLWKTLGNLITALL